MPRLRPATPDGAEEAPRLSIRLDLGGGMRIGPGKVRLLEEIGRNGSISGAGRALRMSYRRAWELVEALNQAVGRPVVETATGGARGGGARLTPAGETVIRHYRAIEAESNRMAAARLGELSGLRPG